MVFSCINTKKAEGEKSPINQSNTHAHLRAWERVAGRHAHIRRDQTTGSPSWKQHMKPLNSYWKICYELLFVKFPSIFRTWWTPFGVIGYQSLSHPQSGLYPEQVTRLNLGSPINLWSMFPHWNGTSESAVKFHSKIKFVPFFFFYSSQRWWGFPFSHLRFFFLYNKN